MPKHTRDAPALERACHPHTHPAYFKNLFRTTFTAVPANWRRVVGTWTSSGRKRKGRMLCSADQRAATVRRALSTPPTQPPMELGFCSAADASKAVCYWSLVPFAPVIAVLVRCIVGHRFVAGASSFLCFFQALLSQSAPGSSLCFASGAALNMKAQTGAPWLPFAVQSLACHNSWNPITRLPPWYHYNASPLPFFYFPRPPLLRFFWRNRSCRIFVGTSQDRGGKSPASGLPQEARSGGSLQGDGHVGTMHGKPLRIGGELVWFWSHLQAPWQFPTHTVRLLVVYQIEMIMPPRQHLVHGPFCWLLCTSSNFVAYLSSARF